MNFFRDRELAQRFRTGDVSEKEQMQYLMVFVLLSTILATANFGHMWYGVELTVYDHLVDVATLLFTILSVLIPYNTNRHGDNCGFLTRYISIGFPIMVKAELAAFVLGAIAMVIDMAIANPELLAEEVDESQWENLPETTGPAGLAAMILVLIYFVYRLNSSMKIASGLQKH